jgi:hypothetical protein
MLTHGAPVLSSISNLFYGLGSGIFLLINLVMFAVCVWAIIDAAVHRREQWASSGHSKAMWITLIVVFTIFFRVVGVVLAIYYLAAIRPKVEGR